MRRNAVADASLLLSLGGASALQLVWADPDHAWHITPIARREIRSEPTHSEISRAILDRRLVVTAIDARAEAELRFFAHWSTVVDDGEAEAIAVALSRGWVVGLEDLFAQRRVTREAGAERWVNAATLLISAVQQGRMSLPAADGVFARLDCYSGYRKRGIVSLSTLLRG